MENIYKVAGTAIIHELLDDEVIIANLDTGVYYSLRDNAVPVWQLLLANYDLNNISICLSEKYAIANETVLTAITPFVDQLLEEGLLIAVQPENKAQNNLAPTLFWPPIFKAPYVEKHEEMKNLLILDPIHEVDEQGWPNRAD